MPKFFINSDVLMHNDRINVKGDMAHHMLDVLRVKIGEKVVFGDSCNQEYICIFDSYNKNFHTMTFTVCERMGCCSELPYKVCLYQGMPQAGMMDLVVQKTVELGVNKIVPIFTKYSCFKQKDPDAKRQRYQRIAEMAAGQSRRGIVPQVASSMSFYDAVAAARFESERIGLVAYENERTTTISDAVGGKKPGEVEIWVGPEGGFADEEIDALAKIGVTPITLGRRILRVETAGPAALVQLQCAWGAEAL